MKNHILHGVRKEQSKGVPVFSYQSAAADQQTLQKGTNIKRLKSITEWINENEWMMVVGGIISGVAAYSLSTLNFELAGCCVTLHCHPKFRIEGCPIKLC